MDVVIIGAGHNGLVAAFYLARAGVRVHVYERREVVGGACVTEELIPGFRFSTFANMLVALRPKIVRDMRLVERGLVVHELNPIKFHPFADGTALTIWRDVERTQSEIARFSVKDAKAWPSWLAFQDRVANGFGRWLLETPPSLARVGASLAETEDDHLFDRVLTSRASDLVGEFFESPEIQTTILSAGSSMMNPADSALGLAWAWMHSVPDDGRDEAPIHHGNPEGGMGAVTRFMAEAAIEAGAEIHVGMGVRHIDRLDRTATGVTLEDGERIEADAIVSNVDPRTTLLDLAGLSGGAGSDIARTTSDLSCVKFHAAVRSIPDWVGSNGHPEVPAAGLVRLCGGLDELRSAWSSHRHGDVPTHPVADIWMPSLSDPTVAPAGAQTLSVWATPFPGRLAGGRPWAGERERVADALIDRIEAYAPGFRSSIIDHRIFVPSDIDATLGMPNGAIHHLDDTPSQLFAMRPVSGMSGYRTPIQGLYLSGAGTYPGGNVSGAPGHNAAHVVLRDRESTART